MYSVWKDNEWNVDKLRGCDALYEPGVAEQIQIKWTVGEAEVGKGGEVEGDNTKEGGEGKKKRKMEMVGEGEEKEGEK